MPISSQSAPSRLTEPLISIGGEGAASLETHGTAINRLLQTTSIRIKQQSVFEHANTEQAVLEHIAILRRLRLGLDENGAVLPHFLWMPAALAAPHISSHLRSALLQLHLETMLPITPPCDLWSAMPDWWSASMGACLVWARMAGESLLPDKSVQLLTQIQGLYGNPVPDNLPWAKRINTGALGGHVDVAAWDEAFVEGCQSSHEPKGIRNGMSLLYSFRWMAQHRATPPLVGRQWAKRLLTGPHSGPRLLQILPDLLTTGASTPAVSQWRTSLLSSWHPSWSDEQQVSLWIKTIERSQRRTLSERIIQTPSTTDEQLVEKVLKVLHQYADHQWSAGAMRVLLLHPDKAIREYAIRRVPLTDVSVPSRDKAGDVKRKF